MRVHLHGNCQVFVLANMLKEVCPDWNVSFFEVHADPIIQQNDVYQDAIRSSDIILSQPIHDGYRGRPELTLGWIREAARPDAKIVVIPAMHFDGHHIGYCGLTNLGDFCSNSVSAHLIAAGVSPGKALDMMLSSDLYTESFVQSEIALSIAEMKRRERDDAIAIKFSPFEEHFARARQAFHIVNHPARPPYAYLLNQVFDYLGTACDRLAFEGQDYQTIPHIPMCASVAFHCQNMYPSDDADVPHNDDLVRLHGKPLLSQHDYYSEMFEQLASRSPGEVHTAIQRVWQAVALLKRLAAADPAFPGIEIWLKH